MGVLLCVYAFKSESKVFVGKMIQSLPIIYNTTKYAKKQGGLTKGYNSFTHSGERIQRARDFGGNAVLQRRQYAQKRALEIVQHGENAGQYLQLMSLSSIIINRRFQAGTVPAGVPAS
jgi:hypothetical protein